MNNEFIDDLKELIEYLKEANPEFESVDEFGNGYMFGQYDAAFYLEKLLEQYEL